MTTQRINDRTLERYLLRELTEEQLAAIDGQAALDEALRGRIERLREADREILAQYPADEMVPAIEALAARLREIPRPGATAPRRGRRSWLRMAAIPGLAAAAAVMLFFAWPLMTGVPLPGIDDGGTRIKGSEAGISVFRRSGGEAELLGKGTRVRERDLLQVSYFTDEARYGMILSIDGSGGVTVHHPTDNAAVRKLMPKRRVLLDRSYELDNAPGFERFILITSAVPLDRERVMTEARRLARDPVRARDGSLDLGADCRQESLLLLKE